MKNPPVEKRMQTYKVVWAIDIDAETPQDAAREAYRIQKDPDSIATVFSVYDIDNGHTYVDMERM